MTATLVLRALGLGDFLTAVPALRGLQRARAGGRPVLATTSALSELVPLAGLDVDVWHRAGLAEGRRLPLRPELAVNLHGKGPESHRLLSATGPRKTIAFRCPGAHPDGPEWDPNEHERERWCRLLEEHGISADPADFHISAPASGPLPGTESATVIHPGAKDPARRWPIARWAEVARRQAAAGRPVIITGSERERPEATAVAAEAGLSPASVWAGRTGLADLASIVSSARLLVSGDTGVAHLGTALSTPSVLLFGPTDPALWGPPPDGPHHVIWKGRTGDPHANTPDPGLLEITADEVTEAMEAMYALATVRPG